MEQLTLLPDPPRASHPGIVYFMTDGYLIKIGYSSRPVKYRSVEVRATVLAFQPGSRTEERQLHQIFKRWCVGSEWFRVPDEPTALLFNAGERVLAETMKGYWGTFVREGAPSGRTAAPWPIFNPAGQIISLQSNDRSFVLSTEMFGREHNCKFWEEIDR